MNTSLRQKIPYVNLALQNQQIKEQLLQAVEEVIDSGWYILGPQVEAFENEFAAYCRTKYAVGVDNGTNALSLVMRSLGIGPGDEVITAANSFLASASSIALVGARPVLVDVREDYNIDPDLVRSAITPRTKAIIPVHLTGRPADMHPICEIGAQTGIPVIEDAAQAIGAEYHGQRVGSFGIAGCFSLHPLKNLAALGDAGIITTNDDNLFEVLRKARNHGLRNRDECEFFSPNCRLDAIQAAMLRPKLKRLDEWTNRRRDLAQNYVDDLRGFVAVPLDRDSELSVYHTFMIQIPERNALQEHLQKNGVETKVHYPVSIHRQPASNRLNYRRTDFPITNQLSNQILSLPIYPELREPQQQYVIHQIRSFFVD